MDQEELDLFLEELLHSQTEALKKINHIKLIQQKLNEEQAKKLRLIQQNEKIIYPQLNNLAHQNHLNKNIVNQFFLRFFLIKNEFLGDKKYSSAFILADEESNILNFYYHCFDMVISFLDGNLILFNLSKENNLPLQNHEYSYHTKELLALYLKEFEKQIDGFEKFKNNLKEDLK